MPSIPEDAIIPDGSHCVSLGDIELVNIFSVCLLFWLLSVGNFSTGHQRTPLRPQPSHVYPNETLIYHGYLGCSPLYPTVTISLWTLAAYHQSHWICPQFSIQAQCKTLCHLHNVRLEIHYYMSVSMSIDSLSCISQRTILGCIWCVSQDTTSHEDLPQCCSWMKHSQLAAS